MYCAILFFAPPPHEAEPREADTEQGERTGLGDACNLSGCANRSKTMSVITNRDKLRLSNSSFHTEPTYSSIRRVNMRWSWIVGQVGGVAKSPSGDFM